MWDYFFESERLLHRVNIFSAIITVFSFICAEFTWLIMATVIYVRCSDIVK